jgi:phospholipid/cholesterol/gamma-HCH transport system ATP-binding protein
MTPIIEMQHVKTKLGDAWVHQDINLTVNRGEIVGIVGGSGSGKTTLLRTLLALTKPVSGSIHVFGEDMLRAGHDQLLSIQTRWGVLFQENALFSALNILENVAFPLQEHTALDAASIADLAFLKLLMAGLLPQDAIKYPSELSGGMARRAGIARAIALDPELLFLDEPTAGLDPETAAGFDALLLHLQSTMGLTVVIVTHDLDTLWTVTDRVAFLGEGRVIAMDPMPQLVKNHNPVIQAFFSGPRGRLAAQSYDAGSDDRGH